MTIRSTEVQEALRDRDGYYLTRDEMVLIIVSTSLPDANSYEYTV
jgi:hypothetical protein